MDVNHESDIDELGSLIIWIINNHSTRMFEWELYHRLQEIEVRFNVEQTEAIRSIIQRLKENNNESK